MARRPSPLARACTLLSSAIDSAIASFNLACSSATAASGTIRRGRRRWLSPSRATVPIAMPGETAMPLEDLHPRGWIGRGL